jgi:hypothetical protein
LNLDSFVCFDMCCIFMLAKIQKPVKTRRDMCKNKQTIPQE